MKVPLLCTLTARHVVFGVGPLRSKYGKTP
ncbi:hypothetical protein RUM8411_02858 [Ruegeria meonggei]|uniref:Uncharacterized protein n=1 Tax=Ruegeria meonggei TaxID=1446476 RepID=A0A1X6ZQR0_9RHOB|nr:hypothetical protein RUM8411_02858 [Ruegeria meonggei]